MFPVLYKIRDTPYGRVLMLTFFFVALAPFVTHYYLTRQSSSEMDFYVKSFRGRTALEDSEDTNDSEYNYKVEELKRNADELERVKLSLKNELRELEGKRYSLQRDIQELLNNINSIQNEASALRADVQRRHQEIEDLRVAKKELNDCPQLPFLKPSKELLLKLSANVETYPRATLRQTRACTLSSCFNFQQCSFLEDFTAHVYNPDKLAINLLAQNNVAQEMYYLLKSMPYSKEVSEPTSCIYVVIIGPATGNSSIRIKDLENSIYNLPFWQGDGHNHLLINLAGEGFLRGVNIGRAALVQSSFGAQLPYRGNFDVLVPPQENLVRYGPSGEVWAFAEPQLPANRKYLLSFEGNYYHAKNLQDKDSLISLKDLMQLSSEAKDINVELACNVEEAFSNRNGWQICGTQASRAVVLKKSTYTLILQSEHTDDQQMSMMRFVEALQYGAIPVVFTDNIILPFEGVIDWQRAAIMLPNAQFPQMHFILRTISVNDLLDMRKQGRFLWETYLSTTKAVLSSMLAVIRTRLSLPSKPLKGTNYPSVFNKENQPVFNPSFNLEILVEHPIKSPTFYRNFTLNNVYARQMWNTYPGALAAFPSDPFVPVLPSSAAFRNSSSGFQPLGKGAGGAGAEFQKALGGDYPLEQFTIVMLTYERELVLIEALGRLAGLRHLNKVIVVWNSPHDPSPDLKWPMIGVPVHVSIVLYIISFTKHKIKLVHCIILFVTSTI